MIGEVNRAFNKLVGHRLHAIIWTNEGKGDPDQKFMVITDKAVITFFANDITVGIMDMQYHEEVKDETD